MSEKSRLCFKLSLKNCYIWSPILEIDCDNLEAVKLGSAFLALYSLLHSTKERMILKLLNAWQKLKSFRLQFWARVQYHFLCGSCVHIKLQVHFIMLTTCWCPQTGIYGLPQFVNSALLVHNYICKISRLLLKCRNWCISLQQEIGYFKSTIVIKWENIVLY